VGTINHTNMFQRAIATPLRVGSAYTARISLRPPSQYFHASPIAYKTATEKVADVADKVNKSVGRGLASAIESGEQVTEKTKEALGTTKDKAVGGAESAEEKTKEAFHSTAEKASSMTSEAKKTKESQSTRD